MIRIIYGVMIKLNQDLAIQNVPVEFSKEVEACILTKSAEDPRYVSLGNHMNKTIEVLYILLSRSVDVVTADRTVMRNNIMTLLDGLTIPTWKEQISA